MASPGSKRPIILGIAGGVLAALLVGLLSGTRALRAFDLLVYDFLADIRCELHPDRPSRQQLLLVLVDEDSQSELGMPWPWPRSAWATVIDRLEANGAKAIGFDVLFLDKGDPQEDEALAEALRRNSNVVIGSKLESSDRQIAGSSMGLGQTRLLLPIFRDEATTGLVNLPFDRDNVVRRFVPSVEAFGAARYAFSMEVYRQATGSFPMIPSREEIGIDYLGPGGTFPSVSAGSVVSGRAFETAPGLCKGKIVLVGVVLSEAKELFATPVSKGDVRCPGVEIHANVIASMLDSSYLYSVPRLPQVLLALLVAAVAGYLAMFRSGKMVVSVYAAMTVAILVGAIPLMVYRGIYFDISYPLLAMPLAYILAGLPARQPMILQTKVGPYQLLGELGRGGMAVVYQARHPRTKEVVALKQMLLEYAADEKALQRFLREMELLQQLNHPNIVRIVDAGDVSGQPYYAMEYISGKSLDDVLREQFRLSSHEVRRICEGVARALDQAHQLGVVHRDLKPSNIMLTATGMPKLTDFGIACKIDAPHLTQAGMLIGTPQYMSPEQCLGDDVTPASDIYSFGATMYHLLTGTPPFPFPETNRIIRSHLSDTPLDVRQKNPNVDEALGRLVMACLAKAPEERPLDMFTIARELDPFHSPTAMETRMPTALGRAADAVTEGGTSIMQSPAPPSDETLERWQSEPTRPLPARKPGAGVDLNATTEPTVPPPEDEGEAKES